MHNYEHKPPSTDDLRIELRRYPNRRYYDSTRSQHLTLDDIYRLVRDGYSVTVSDSKSGDDITARVLTQLILEHDPLEAGGLSGGVVAPNYSFQRIAAARLRGEILHPRIDGLPKIAARVRPIFGADAGLYGLPAMGAAGRR